MEECATQAIPYQFITPVKHPNPVTSLTMTHKLIVRSAKDAGFPYVLIMEDDVAFTVPGAFNHFMDWVKSNQPSIADIYTAGSYTAFSRYNEIDGTVRNISGTHCYVVTAQFYQRFLTMPNDVLIDTNISKYADVIRMAYPMCALQRPGHSDLKNATVNYNTNQFINYPLYQIGFKEYCQKFT
jgi:GR25 family glycosyltransferase involved in LPS biosynthesis